MNKINIESGIYKITNIVTNEIYLGQSNFLELRKHQYFNISKIQASGKLKKSFLLHGRNNHKFEIVELCEVNLLDFKEWYYINKIYNSYEIGLNASVGNRGKALPIYYNMLLNDYNNLKDKYKLNEYKFIELKKYINHIPTNYQLYLDNLEYNCNNLENILNDYKEV